MKADAVKVEFHLPLRRGTLHNIISLNAVGVKYDNKTQNRKIPLVWNIKKVIF